MLVQEKIFCIGSMQRRKMKRCDHSWKKVNNKTQPIIKVAKGRKHNSEDLIIDKKLCANEWMCQFDFVNKAAKKNNNTMTISKCNNCYISLVSIFWKAELFKVYDFLWCLGLFSAHLFLLFVVLWNIAALKQ